MERMQREENPVADDLLRYSQALLDIIGGPILTMFRARDQVYRQISGTLGELCELIRQRIDSEAARRQGTPDQIQEMRRLIRQAGVKLGDNRRVNAHNLVRGEMAAGPASRQASSNAVRVELAEDSDSMEMEGEVKIEATADNRNNQDTTIEELMEEEDEENVSDDEMADEVKVEAEEETEEVVVNLDLNDIRLKWLERLRPRPADLFLRWRNARCYICQKLL